eukprot:7380874-Prymnesium_polylepis.1
MFVESQLSAADVELSPEQKAEAGRAFHHFDKSGDGFLNEDEVGCTWRHTPRDHAPHVHTPRGHAPRAHPTWPRTPHDPTR